MKNGLYSNETELIAEAKRNGYRHEAANGGCSPVPCSPDVVSWDRWKKTLDERDEARREIERVKRLVRTLDDSPKSLLNHLVSWANTKIGQSEEQPTK